MDPSLLESRLQSAMAARAELLEAPHETAFRLYSGFAEGLPGLALDVYADCLVVQDHSDPPGTLDAEVHPALGVVRAALPWLRSVLWKRRAAADPERRKGVLAHGDALPRRIREDGVWYAIDLRLNQDSSFYLDTRNLRQWAKQTLAGRSVLNTFAYTGSIGVAALAGGAARVVQLDRNRGFLNVAKVSCELNRLPVRRADFLTGDFFAQVARMRRSGELFDCVVVDPPFFSVTGAGRVDLVRESQRVLNKVRPLIADGGWLVAINNALFVSGAEYLATLDALSADGYLGLERTIPVPADLLGSAGSPGAWPADPAPFNHPTKIAVLRVRRKA